MNCFVTGATGFVGSNLVRELLAHGHRVKALARPDSDRRALAGLNVEWVAGGVGDRELLRCEIRLRVVLSRGGELLFVAPGLHTDV